MYLLLQATQGLNPVLPHCRRILYQLSRQGSLLQDTVKTKLKTTVVTEFSSMKICQHSIFKWGKNKLKIIEDNPKYDKIPAIKYICIYVHRK